MSKRLEAGSLKAPPPYAALWQSFAITTLEPKITSGVSFFTGHFCLPVSTQEQNLRDCTLEGSMSAARARRVLECVPQPEVWRTRLGFVEAVAALARDNSQDLPRKLLTAGRMFYNLTGAERWNTRSIFFWVLSSPAYECSDSASFRNNRQRSVARRS